MGTAYSTVIGWFWSSASTVNRFRQPEYIRWLKVGQGLQCCAEGLIDFCTDVIDNFHKSLKQQHGVCPSPSTPKGIKYDKKKKCCEVNCACGICDRWFQSVKQEKATAQFSWKNTNLQDWSLHPWQLAKVFMGPGQDPTSYDPADTDPAGFLQLILNCKLFAGLVDATKVHAVSLWFLFTKLDFSKKYLFPLIFKNADINRSFVFIIIYDWCFSTCICECHRITSLFILTQQLLGCHFVIWECHQPVRSNTTITGMSFCHLGVSPCHQPVCPNTITGM